MAPCCRWKSRSPWVSTRASRACGWSCPRARARIRSSSPPPPWRGRSRRPVRCPGRNCSRRSPSASPRPPPGGMRCLALVRIDKFAALERVVGATASEEVITEVARLLKETLTPKEVVGRFGGVRFLALLERGNEHDISAWSERLLSRVQRHVMRVHDKSVAVTCTIGLSVVSPGDTRLDAVIADAIESARKGSARGGNQSISSGPRRQRQPRHVLRPGVGQAHQGGAHGEPLPPGAAADREPAGRGSGHVRRAGAHDRPAGQGSAALGVHGRRRPQRPAEEHRSLGGRRLAVLRRAEEAPVPVRAPVARERARLRLRSSGSTTTCAPAAPTRSACASR